MSRDPAVCVVVRGKGHKNVTASHPTTIEFTRDSHISPRADCILLVSCDKALIDFPRKAKMLAKEPDTLIEVVVTAGGVSERITGRGHPSLTYSHARDIVIRRSTYACPRTLMVMADKAAKDVNRLLVKVLKQEATATVKIKYYPKSYLRVNPE